MVCDGLIQLANRFLNNSESSSLAFLFFQLDIIEMNLSASITTPPYDNVRFSLLQISSGRMDAKKMLGMEILDLRVELDG